MSSLPLPVIREFISEEGDRAHLHYKRAEIYLKWQTTNIFLILDSGGLQNLTEIISTFIAILKVVPANRWDRRELDRESSS